MEIQNKAVESLMDKGTFWFPEAVTTLAREVDLLYYVILWVSIFFFVGISYVLFYFCFKYKKTEKNLKAKKQVTHNLTLELLWTIIPLILVMIVFVWGYKDYLKLAVVPNGSMDIRVTGSKWTWTFDYPRDGLTTINELVVPVGKSIGLTMSSQDVLHSFFVPNFKRGSMSSFS